VLDSQDYLRNHLQITIHEHVKCVRDDAFGGIFDGHNAVIRAILTHLGEDVGDGFLCGVAQARTETPDRRLMRKCSLRTEISDGHGLFQGECTGHDFAINGTELVIGHRSTIEKAEPLQHGAFAVGCVDFLPNPEFHLADGEHVLGAFVEQPDDLAVQLVNGTAMLRNVHDCTKLTGHFPEMQKNLTT